jgi:glycosyltransferase involved in cell wall biosynthesis
MTQPQPVNADHEEPTEVPLKVWYVVMSFPGPSETFVGNDVTALAQLGITISVHALRGRRADCERLLRERRLADLVVTHGGTRSLIRGTLLGFTRPVRTACLVAWIVRQSGGRLMHLGKGLALVPRLVELFEHLERDRPDVVHIYWGHYPAIFGWLVLTYAPRVVVSLSLSAYDLLRGFPGSIAVAKRAHLVSTWAGANLPAMAARGLVPESVYVSWQGIDLTRIRQHHFSKVPRRIVTAGRLIRDKGMDDVIRAFARVAVEYPDASLLILGDGPDRGRLENLAAALGVGDAVTFRGHVAHDEVFDELTRAELFLFLSRYAGERLPNVVKEAMACRCLVVTTASSGIEELMQHGVHGRVVPLGAWEQAAAWVLEAFADLEATQVMAAEAQRHVAERFDLTRLMAGMVRKWRERQAGVRVETAPPASLASAGSPRQPIQL